MPWYMKPTQTCKVLNRLADRYSTSSLQDLNIILEQATQTIWYKQEQYYNSRFSNNNRSSGEPAGGGRFW